MCRFSAVRWFVFARGCLAQIIDDDHFKAKAPERSGAFHVSLNR
jgi:hypothetical protein